MKPEQLTVEQKEYVDLLQGLSQYEKTSNLASKIKRQIELGYPDVAKTLCWNEMDKFRQTPGLAKLLHEQLFGNSSDSPFAGPSWQKQFDQLK